MKLAFRRKLALLLFVLVIPFALGVSCCCFAKAAKEVPPCHAKAPAESETTCQCADQFIVEAKQTPSTILFSSASFPLAFTAPETRAGSTEFHFASTQFDSSPPLDPRERIFASFIHAHAPPRA